jgi:HPr kinase/phosphorylase
LGGSAETSYLHATAVVIGEAGVLICGPPGAGKSTLALSLIAAAEEAGNFARLVGDDRIGISMHGDRIIAHGHPSILGKIERRGLGIVAIPYVTAAVLRAVIQLSRTDEPAPRCPEPGHDQFLLAETKLPCLRMRQDAAPAGLAPAILADLRLRRIIS